MKKEIRIKPIGIIHTPYKEPRGIPIQGRFDKDVTGIAEVFPEYRQGLRDVREFSHLILIYFFHKSKREQLVSMPFLEDRAHGVFAIRTPHRPNHIGFSIVKIQKVEDNKITFSQVDMLDGTPLLDIKPYVSHFDCRDKVKNGWIAKHFRARNIPVRVKIGKTS